MTAPGVLVTRPAGQADTMLALLQQAGYRAWHVPALTIHPHPVSAAERARLLDLDQYHAVFFVSTNAVRYGMEMLADLWPQWPMDLHWLAVGEATATALRDWQVPVQAPDQGFNSEAVLALPCLAQVQDRRILILRGNGGRDWLTERLQERGGRVDRITVYRRECAKKYEWPRESVGAVLVTSVESWQCVRRHVPEITWAIAGSDRIGTAIRASGHGRVAVAESPHDEDMLQCLTRILKHP